MANPTTNYGWVLPTSTDLVTDLPADFDVALQGVDTTTKALNPSTTLGDIEYRSATANTNTRLGIGSTGNVLTVTGGVPVWAAPAAPSTAKNYSLLNAGGTALTGASTITVSGISGVDSIMVLVNGLRATNASQLVVFRFNTDTGNNYTGLGPIYQSLSTYAASNLTTSGSFDSDKFRTATTSSNTLSNMDIGLFMQGANSAGIKMIQSTAGAEADGGTGNTMSEQYGFYKGTSTISSVSIITDSNFTHGTMYVYGSA